MAEESMKIGIGSDHAAFPVKEELKRLLGLRGLEVVDFGTGSAESCDYPDIARPLAEAVSSGRLVRGVLLCGSGLGMSYAANKLPGVRAALCWSAEAARLSREHNDANILVLPGRIATLDPLPEIMQAWLDTDFSQDERHSRRIAKIGEIERSTGKK